MEDTCQTMVETGSSQPMRSSIGALTPLAISKNPHRRWSQQKANGCNPYLACMTHIAELFDQLQEPSFSRMIFCSGGHGVLQSAEAGRFATSYAYSWIRIKESSNHHGAN